MNSMIDIARFSTCAIASKSLVGVLEEDIRSVLAERKKLLILVSGGSAIPIVVNLTHLLRTDLYAKNITIALIDERYGEVGHEDSNWQQMLTAGFIARDYSVLPVLRGSTFAETIGKYENALKIALGECDYSIGLYGMGTDGHIAGMLPTKSKNEFMKFTDNGLVTGYKSGDFMRITTTASLIHLLNRVVLFACGAEKMEQIHKLDKDLPKYKQPVQLLKKAKKFQVFYGEEK